jgi:hypothetical protein
MHSIIAFESVSSVVVIGQDAEMADYGNPRGYRYGLSFAVRARNEHGDTWEQHVVTGSHHDEAAMAARTERVCAALQARLANLGKLPVDAARWQQGRAVYGSAAYEAYGQDEDVALERREAEEEAWGF